MSIRALTILNDQGDQTIVWTEDRDAEMEAIIAKKMAQGVRFFIIEPRAFGLLPPKEKKLAKATDAKKHRSLSVKDEDFAAFVGMDGADVVKTPAESVRGTRLSEDPAEVAKSQAVGTKPMKGG